MQYGFFDDNKKEYVITSPNTPRSWSNYLGSTEYGTIINNNAEGLSYSKHSNIDCYLRKKQNYNTFRYPGKYIYIRDNQSKNYWSTSWQPVCKPLDQYKYECRHGSDYTIIESEYDEIKSKTHYFVPKGQTFEIWHLKLKNLSLRERKLSLFSFLEYKDYSSEMEIMNLRNLQRLEVIDGVINHSLITLNAKKLMDIRNPNNDIHTFNAFIGGSIVGFETDLKSFIGESRGNSNPLSVQRGYCSNSKASEKDLCSVLQIDAVLEPNEIKDFFVFVGIGRADYEGKDIIEKYGNIEAIERELNYLINNKTHITNAIRIF